MDHEADVRVGVIAARQHGLISAQQASTAGLSRTQIQHRVRTGRWERMARGIYRIAGAPPSRPQPAMAAVLSRPDGAISFLNAAELFGLSVVGPPVPWLTVPTSSSARAAVARVHRSDLPTDQIDVVQGIRVTTAARTLVDCSALLGQHRLGKLVDEAMHRRLTSPQRVEAILDAARDRSLVARHEVLRDLIDVWRPSIRPGSPAEARLLRVLGEWGFPPPERQVRIYDADGTIIARLDGGWPDRRIGFEYDSPEWHGPARWASDEARHALVEALGWTLLHIDKTDITPGATRLRDRLVVAFVPNPLRLAGAPGRVIGAQAHEPSGAGSPSGRTPCT
jgi:hypothetical protein